MSLNALVGNHLDYCNICLGVSRLLIFVSCNVFKIALLESLPTPVSTHTPLLSGSLSIGYLLKSVLYLRLPYWCTSFLHSGYPKYFAPFLKPSRHRIYNTRKSKADGGSLRSHTLPLHYISLLSILASALLYDATMIWNDLPDDVHSATSLHSLRKKLKTDLFEKAYPPIVFTPQPLRAVRVLFSPMVSGWAGGWWEKVCPGCISETVRCRKLILGRDIGLGCRCAASWCDLDLTCDLDL